MDGKAEGMAKGRSPHGERGLKSWALMRPLPGCSRSPHGERGLKSRFTQPRIDKVRRSPHGERGLKFRWEGHFL